MAYSEKVIDHYENPRNVGAFDKKEQNVGSGMVGAPACGDVMQLQIKVSDNGIIEDARFKTYGCGSAIASSSLITEWVKGKSLDEAGAIKNSQIAEELESWSLGALSLFCLGVSVAPNFSTERRSAPFSPRGRRVGDEGGSGHCNDSLINASTASIRPSTSLFHTRITRNPSRSR